MVRQAIANAITTKPGVPPQWSSSGRRRRRVPTSAACRGGHRVHVRPPAGDHTRSRAGQRGQAPGEMGHAVVGLLDSINRLGRAYNLAAPRRAGSVRWFDSTGSTRPSGSWAGPQHRGRRLAHDLATAGSRPGHDDTLISRSQGHRNAEPSSTAGRRQAGFPAIDSSLQTRKEEMLLSKTSWPSPSS